MIRFRFSLLALFGFVAIVCVGCAALTKPSTVWCWIATGALLVLLFFSLLAVVYGEGASRAFWVGVAIVGWGFTGVQCIESHASWSWPLNTSHLVENVATAIVEPGISPSSPFHQWQRIAKAYLTLLLACVGGVVARRLYFRQLKVPVARRTE